MKKKKKYLFVTIIPMNPTTNIPAKHIPRYIFQSVDLKFSDLFTTCRRLINDEGNNIQIKKCFLRFRIQFHLVVAVAQLVRAFVPQAEG